MITVIRAFLIVMSLIFGLESLMLYAKNPMNWNKNRLFITIIIAFYFGLVAVYVWSFG